MNYPVPFSGFGDDTNTSVKFNLVHQGGMVGDWNSKPRLAQFDILYSNRTTTQYRGMDAEEIELKLMFGSLADYSFFKSLRGTRHTLRYLWDITDPLDGTCETLLGIQYLNLPNTLLLSVDSIQRHLKGPIVVDATFQRAAVESAYYGFAVYAEDDAP